MCLTLESFVQKKGQPKAKGGRGKKTAENISEGFAVLDAQMQGAGALAMPAAVALSGAKRPMKRPAGAHPGTSLSCMITHTLPGAHSVRTCVFCYNCISHMAVMRHKLDSIPGATL
jgi:hypothetical protein